MPHTINDNDDINTPATATAPTLPPCPNVTAPANTTEPEQVDVSLELDFNFDAEEENSVNESESIAPAIKKKRRGGKNKTVASLIIKTLQTIGILRENDMGNELNIVFDNCSGQNKNNTILKLICYLTELGFF